ncbi:hypothetical protein pipiens_015857, partial [Culex pipiens pipiens]
QNVLLLLALGASLVCKMSCPKLFYYPCIAAAGGWWHYYGT